MLDKIEDALEVKGIKYDRLDGTMKRDERIRAMDALKHDPACEVLLVSLKAGGVGLNLTAAQRVYLVDPYWYGIVLSYARSTSLYSRLPPGTLPLRTRLSTGLSVPSLLIATLTTKDNFTLAPPWSDQARDNHKTYYRKYNRSQAPRSSEEEDGVGEHDPRRYE